LGKLDFWLGKKWVREADPDLTKKLDNGWVECDLCWRRCKLPPDTYGVCGVRANIKGKLYTLVYGLVTAANVDPIEKKPLMHFEPGAQVFSISTAGCNFFCRFCQNWEISQARKEDIYGKYLEPERIVELAKNLGADGISFTYNEPTIFFEYMYDVAKIAKKEGLFTTMVTNGYMTPEAIRKLGNLMDAATVDFKGSANKEFYRRYMAVPDPSPIFDSLKVMKEVGWFIEITDLIVPKVGDKEEDLRRLAEWVRDNLGPETPFHLLRFHPDYLMRDFPQTPVETLERLAKIAKEEVGLHYVYLGNVPGHPLENTYCPNCGELVVERYGFYIVAWKLKDDFRCPKCGYRLNFKGRFHGTTAPW